MWDRLNTHVSKAMQGLVAELEWLTVVLLPGYAPDLNPVEGLWAHIKRSLANLAARTLSSLETLLRRRLKALQYRQPSSTDSSQARGSPSTDRTDPKTPRSVCAPTVQPPWGSGPAGSPATTCIPAVNSARISGSSGSATRSACPC
ncbi:transposase [Streptomyces sp. NPDC052036]|uniref:transposase n=1 Tax=Streptomyces sp. NPDC052036 TaxID=3155171 RepID=UPI00341B1DE9